MKSHLVTKRYLAIQGREDRKEIMDDNTLKINGKSLSFKESDIKLFRKLKNSIDGLDRVLRESGKIPDWKRKEFIVNMTEGYLSVMIVLHDILSSTLDIKYHSVRRVVSTSRSTEEKIVNVFVAAGAAAKTQPWLAWEVMAQYDCIASCHTRLQKRLNGAIITALKKAVRSLEEQRKGVKDLGNYLVEIAIFSLQIEENIETLLDNSDLLRLEEHQVSQLHKLLGRVKTLLEWKRPRPQS